GLEPAALQRGLLDAAHEERFVQLGPRLAGDVHERARDREPLGLCGTGPVADGRKQAQGLRLAQAHEDRDRAGRRPRRPFHACASATSRVFQRTLLLRIRRAENQPEVLAGTLVLGLRYPLRSGRVLLCPLCPPTATAKPTSLDVGQGVSGPLGI